MVNNTEQSSHDHQERVAKREFDNAVNRYIDYNKQLIYYTKVEVELEKPKSEQKKRLVGSWSKEGVETRANEYAEKMAKLRTQYPQIEKHAEARIAKS